MTVRFGLRMWGAPLLAGVFLACATTPPGDACSLLTPADLEKTQGERPVETNATQQGSNQQCFYRLPTFAKSISLTVSSDARELWEESVRGERREEEGEEEGKERPKPRTISGLGDEVVWSPSPVGGTLYVLQDETMLRISIGGADTDPVRFEKATTLARKALRRLKREREPLHRQ